MSATRYDAIVIGAGIGGLAACLMLAHQGKKTLLLERTKRPGGRLSSFRKDGFHVDLGVHVISRSDKGPIGEVLRRVGIPNPITYTHVRPVSSHKGKIFIFPHDLENMVPGAEFRALMAFLGDVRSMPEERVSQYDDVDLKAMLSQYTEEPFIHACISNVCSIYMCLPAWLASAGEFMRCLRYEAAARASGYPEGGCSVIANTYCEGIEAFGGEIRLLAGARKIEVEGGRVKGVVVGDELLETDMVVSNADIKNTVLNLVGPEFFPADYVDYVKDLEYSWAGPVVRVATDRELTDIKMLTQIGSADQEGYYEKLREGIIPEELNLFMVVPSNFSPSVAPKGKQLICIGTPVEPGTNDIHDEIVEAVLDTAEIYIPGLRENARWIQVMSTHALGKLAGEEGAGIGIGQIAGQCGDKRPKIKTPIEGLYVVGGEAGGTGVGTELCVNSAMEFIDMIT